MDAKHPPTDPRTRAKETARELADHRRTEAALREALHAAEAANVEKSRFLATMSHEIRTPINAILGYAELLDLGLQGTLSPGQTTYVARIRSSGRHLLALVEDVLDYARAEAGRLSVEGAPIALAGAVGDAADALRPLAGQRGVVLEAACPAELRAWGDERRVRQVLVNLVGNAVKFTARDGVVRITCGMADAAPDAAHETAPGPWAWVRVEDTGIGIPEDRIGAVFEPFVQVDGSLTREHPGTGLGLAIARRLARLMGGDLLAESRVGEGSAFTLWVPAEAWEPAPAVEEAPTGEAARFAGLSRAGRYLAGAAGAVVRACAERLREEPAVPMAARCSAAELEDHLLALIADMSQALVILGEDGPEAPSIARDGTELQRFVARRHGDQRRRLGWTEQALRVETRILREETEAALRQARGIVPDVALETALQVVHRLLHRAEADALVALRAPPPAGG